MKHRAAKLSALNQNQIFWEHLRASPCSTCEHPPAAEAAPWLAQRCRGARIIGAFTLEKTFKIIESYRKPNAAKSTTKLCPKGHVYTYFDTSRVGDSTNSLGSLFQCMITLSVKNLFLTPNLKFPWYKIVWSWSSKHLLDIVLIILWVVILPP